MQDAATSRVSIEAGGGRRGSLDAGAAMQDARVDMATGQVMIPYILSTGQVMRPTILSTGQVWIPSYQVMSYRPGPNATKFLPLRFHKNPADTVSVGV